VTFVCCRSFRDQHRARFVRRLLVSLLPRQAAGSSWPALAPLTCIFWVLPPRIRMVLPLVSRFLLGGPRGLLFFPPFFLFGSTFFFAQLSCGVPKSCLRQPRLTLFSAFLVVIYVSSGIPFFFSFPFGSPPPLHVPTRALLGSAIRRRRPCSFFVRNPVRNDLSQSIFPPPVCKSNLHVWFLGHGPPGHPVR